MAFSFSIELAELGSPDAQRLLRALNAELGERYPEEGATFLRLDHEEVAPERGAFMLVRMGEQIVGCGAVRLLAPSVGHERPRTAEIKRMYMMPVARGRGAGRALLETLEDYAVRLGATRLVLETGDRQPEALALYEKSGFVRIPSFGEYADSPLGVCMEKQL